MNSQADYVASLLPCRRKDLPMVFGVNERTAREMIYRARECGLPVLMPDRDSDQYRVAETEDEVRQVYLAMKERALRSLVAAERMIRRYQPDTQTRI